MFINSDIKELNDREIVLGGRTLVEDRWCVEERFSTQPALSHCSGFLIAEDLIVTAGRCMDSMQERKNSSWVFDYHVDNEYQGKSLFRRVRFIKLKR